MRPTQRIATGSRFARGPAAADVEIDYTPVIHDLKQIGVLAAAAFVVLLGLAFAIR